MSENKDPDHPGVIEVIEAEDLTPEHKGRQVSAPYDNGRIHGVLNGVKVSKMGVQITVGPVCYPVAPDTLVSVIVTTAAEATQEARA